MLKPREPAPELEVPTLPDGVFRLSEQKPPAFTMIVNYRGYHCPICKAYLRELDRKLPEFERRGVEVIAISGDAPERAAKSREEWKLERLRLGYGQSIDSMREWGLLISRAIKPHEPEMFGEPGLFLVRPDGTLYHEAIQSSPFTRPALDQLLAAIDYVIANDYPARGES